MPNVFVVKEESGVIRSIHESKEGAEALLATQSLCFKEKGVWYYNVGWGPRVITITQYTVLK